MEFVHQVEQPVEMVLMDLMVWMVTLGQQAQSVQQESKVQSVILVQLVPKD